MKDKGSSLNVIKYFTDGLTEVVASFLYVFKLGGVGIKTLVLLPSKVLFNASSSKVDKVYKNTKVLVDNAVNTAVNMPKEATEQKEEATETLDMDVKPVPEVQTVQEKPESFLAKAWKVLNGDLGQNKSKSQIAKLEEKKKLLQEELASPEAKRNTEAKVYTYVAKTPGGKWVDGRFIGFSKMDVNSFLLNEGYEVYSIENNKMIDFMYGETKFSNHRMKNKDIIFFLTQLSTYIKAGITLNDSVKILMNQSSKDKTKRSLYQAIAYQLTMGESFSEALRKQTNIFPPLLINMLKAAEATGELEETLDDMVDYYTEIETNRQEMINAMTYPVLVLIFASGVVAFIMVKVLPEFSKIYEGLDVNITGLTSFLLNSSQFLQNYIWLIILIIVGVVGTIVILYKKIYLFRRTLQVIMMKTPVFGNIIIFSEVTVFSKTFSSLLRNNVNITESIDILSKVTSNEIYKEIMRKTINNISRGDKISEAFKDHWAVPDVAYHMIVTGESTGQLAEMMNRVARYYQEQHHSLVGNMKQFIEPILIVTLAVVVGGIILAVIVPMFDMYQQISLS